MQETRERVFAYQQAKVIDYASLAEVTGGAGMQWSHRETLQATGASGSGVDAVMDTSMDW